MTYDSSDPAVSELFRQRDSTQHEAKLSLKFKGDELRGKAAGVLKRTANDAYRLELSARGANVLTAYITDSLTVVWPENAIAVVISEGRDLKLSELIPELPDWPFRECLPFVFCTSIGSIEVGSTRNKLEAAQIESRFTDGRVLVRRFSRRTDSQSFPFARIEVVQPGGGDRLLWTIIP